MIYDTEKRGFETVLFDYQAYALKYILSSKEPVSSRVVWNAINDNLKKVSRTTVINGLSQMVDLGFLEYTEQTGKGGIHRVYVATKTEEGIATIIIRKLVMSIYWNWPDVALTYMREQEEEGAEDG